MSNSSTLTQKSRNKWEILILIWVAYFLNQADRQIFGVLVTDIQASLNLSSEDTGLIGTIFSLFYAFLVPFCGIMGNQFSRKWILTICIIFWSVATMFTGLATGMISLILLRSLATGGGEAFFGPNYNAMIAEYHTKTRAIAMSIVQMAYYIGMIVSGIVATYIAKLFGDWRYAFLVFGGFGIIWGILMIFRLKDKRDMAAIKADPEYRPLSLNEALRGIWNTIKIIFTTPTAVAVVIGFSGLIFGLNGYLQWMTAFVQEMFPTMEKVDASTHAMLYTHLAAFIGIMIAGPLSNMANKHPQRRTTMQGLGLILSIPFILMMTFPKEISSNLINEYIPALTVMCIGLAGFGFFRAFFDANTYVVLYDVIPAKYHSSASGVLIMAGFGIGSLSTWLIGKMQVATGSYQSGFVMIAIVWGITGILTWIGGKLFYKRDILKLQQNEK